MGWGSNSTCGVQLEYGALRGDSSDVACSTDSRAPVTSGIALNSMEVKFLDPRVCGLRGAYNTFPPAMKGVSWCARRISLMSRARDLSVPEDAPAEDSDPTVVTESSPSSVYDEIELASSSASRTRLPPIREAFMLNTVVVLFSFSLRFASWWSMACWICSWVGATVNGTNWSFVDVCAKMLASYNSIFFHIQTKE